MAAINRFIVIVLDSVGIGELPDAAELQRFERVISRHTMINEGLKTFFEGFSEFGIEMISNRIWKTMKNMVKVLKVKQRHW